MTEDTILDAIDKMEKAVEHVQSQFTTVRTGRASPALVEKLMVDYYGSMVPVQQLAGFQVPEARQLIVKPHDRNSLGAIEKAIRDSDLGVSPSNDGVIIRLNFPPLTEERRKEYVKIVKNMAEDGRIAVHITSAATPASISMQRKRRRYLADELERAEKEIERITHEHVEMIDKALGRKDTNSSGPRTEGIA